MKLSLVVLLAIGLLLSFYSINNAEGKPRHQDLLTIIENAEENGVSLQSWTIYEREAVKNAIHKNELFSTIDQIKENYQNYHWETIHIEADQHYMWKGTKLSDNQYIIEEMKLTAYPSGEFYQLLIIKETHGTSFDEEALNLQAKTDTKAKEIFYTIRGQLPLQHSLSEEAAKIIKSLDGNVVEDLTETNFLSLSAYTNKLDVSMLTKNNNKMNVQIGLRTITKDDVINVTIGTPIITTEY